ncbi:hypothetical protein NP233_g6708 [Leucocoprinus birnbaumii]|uniref:BTB domain-containing protein n=1 Tax=Leucocoprinus birnbaumii TaxID=56174 RepID=A0AAD5VTW5_9AGAR|nr:hypothetical protein NP233_g6708 [Leucocoprinus birnbaumii]
MGEILSPLAVELQKHPIYWFDEGSLILEVQDVHFRVHGALFQRHSPFLASTKLKKLIGTTLVTDDAHEGTMFVSCEADRGVTWRDIEILLGHMYHDFPLSSESSLERIIAVLRSTSPQQLDMPKPHAHAKQIFASYFDSRNLSEIKPEVLYEALPIARILRIMPVLKKILYHTMVVANLDPDDAEGTLSDPQKQTTASTLPALTNDAGKHQLTESDAKLCKSLMARVIDHFTPMLFTVATTGHMACTDVLADTWMTLVISPAINDGGVYKPIETLERMKGINWGEHGLCSTCVAEKCEEWSEEQEAVWAMIEKWLEDKVDI